MAGSVAGAAAVSRCGRIPSVAYPHRCFLPATLLLLCLDTCSVRAAHRSRLIYLFAVLYAGRPRNANSAAANQIAGLQEAFLLSACVGEQSGSRRLATALASSAAATAAHLAAAAQAAAASTAPASLTSANGTGAAAAAPPLARLLAGSPLAGIVVAALACVALTVGGLALVQAVGLLRRRPAFTLLMQNREGGEAMDGYTTACGADAAEEEEA